MAGEKGATMADIVHHFPIQAPSRKVFDAVSTPSGLDSWWTKRCVGRPAEGAEYELWFGPQYDWRAVVRKCTPPTEFIFEMIRADDDWRGTALRFQLREENGVTHVRFEHLGWPQANEHFRTSNFCWAMYLRLLKRYVERGEVVPYDARLEA
jgi:uncharacterized protein YndB with AHSA1/START domain